MKLTVEKQTLSNALAKISGVVEKRNTIAILSNVAFTAKDNKLTLRVTDLDIEATTSIEADVAEDGNGTVALDLLSKVVKGMSDSPVAMVSDGERLRVSSGRSKFNFATLSIGDFPDIATPEYTATFTLDADTLKHLLDNAAFAMSNEATRFFLNGIYLHRTEDGITAVATDGHRLAKVWSSDCMDEFPAVIIPRKAVNELRKVVDSGDVEISVSDNKIRFILDNAEIISKVIDGTFPDYERVIPKDNTDSARVDAKSFSRTCALVSMINEEKSKSVKMAIGEDSIVMSSHSGVNESEDGIEAVVTGKPASIGFNSKYMTDILSNDIGGEVDIFYKSDDAGVPVLIKPTDDSTFLAVLMPMRV
jgi:DNA polymerase-3 subunit beta